MAKQQVTVHVEVRTVIRLLLALALFGLAVFLLFRLSTILFMFAVSFFLALALTPPVNRLASFLPGHNRVLATGLAYIIVLGILGGFVYIAVPPIVQQTSSFVNNFPSYIESLAGNESSLSSVIERYDLEDEVNNAIQELQGAAGGIAQNLGSTLVSGITSAISGLIILLTILVLTFFMLIEGPSAIERWWKLYHNKRKLARDKRLAKKMYKVVTGYVNGQVLIAAIAAASVFVVLFVLGQFFTDVPLGAVAPLTGIAFICTLIPMFGATIATIIITLVLLLNSIPAAIIFLVFFIIYQQIENNVIQPIVQSHSIQLTALAVLSAAVIGIALAGIVGALLAIPIAGCLRVLLLDFINHRKDYWHEPGDSHTSKSTG